MSEFDRGKQAISREFFTDHLKTIISTAIDDVDKVELGDEVTPPDPTVIIMSWERLRSILSAEQFELIEHLWRIDPYVYGFKGDKIMTMDQPIESFTIVSPQHYKKAVTVERDEGRSMEIVDRETTTQFMPTHAWNALDELNVSMQAAIGKQVVVESGYRSPAYQMMLFITLLRDQYDYDIEKTVQHVALPDFSEHSSFEMPAADLQSADPLPVADDPASFDQTPEFAWLQQHAEMFGFELSYPKNNDKGVMYEPWHWRFVGLP